MRGRTSIESGAIRRRDLLQAGGVLGAAGAMAALVNPSAADAAETWAQEFDVVVAGSGAAGLSAAIAAAQAGASVVILEKAASVGGTTIKSDGAIWIPNNHHMRAAGKADPKADAIGYMAHGSYPNLFRATQPRLGLGEREYGLIETYYDNAAAVIEAHESANVTRWKMVELPDYQDHSPYDRAPNSRILVPVTPDGGIGNGRELTRQLRAWVEANKIPVLLHHEVREVRRNARGEVIGVIAATPSGDVAIRARKAVVFGSGGYTHNPELMLNFQPGPIFGGCAVPTNQGDFIRIGALLGAKLGNMVNAWRAQLILEDALRSASVSRDIWQVPGDSVMLVNRLGRRVVDETRNYHDRTRAHFHWDPLEQEYVNKLLFMVYDQRTAELFAGDYPLPAPGTTESYVLTADALPALSQALATRLEDLEPQIGVVRLAEDFDTRLADQVQRFNADAKAGVDSEFGRGKYPYDAVWDTTINSVPRKDTKWPAPQGANPTLHPLDSAGPFHAIILGAANLDTNGGPMTDAGARVLDANNRPIPGLFGAGNCIAAPAAAAYWGAGATIGPAMTFGTLAGRAAAAEPVKEA